MPLQVKKIICMKLWGLGNLTIIYPLLYKIKEKFPEAKIIFITFDLNKGFLENNKAIDRIVYFVLTRNILRIAKQFFGLLQAMKKEKADMLINFELMNNASGLFSYWANSSLKLGIADNYRNIFYDYSVDNDQTRHISEIFSSLLRPMGINSSYRYPDFKIPPEAAEKVKKLLSGLGIREFVCIHPGTSENFKGKRYSKHRFRELADLIADEYNMPLLFTGTSSENRLIEDIIKGRKDKLFNLAGKLHKWEFVELLGHSHMIICNDSWTAHIASALAKNSVIFYGPTSPQRYGPLRKNSVVFYKNFPCSPCIGIRYAPNKCRRNFACLDFSPQEVFSMMSERFFDAEKT
jgi:ADP-heptose:LPS heptosyltransferase